MYCPSELTAIYSYAFDSCTSLKYVHIPQNVSYIADGVFYRCNALEQIEVSGLNKNYVTSDGMLFTYGYKEVKKFPASRQDTEVIVPYGTTKISNFAFDHCTNLKKVVMYEGVKQIGEYAFEGCTSLENVEIPRSTETFGDGCFEGTPDNMILYGVKGSPLEIYANDYYYMFQEQTYFKVCAIKLKDTEVTIKGIGVKYKLYDTVVPSYATDPAIVWESSSPDVADVDENGVVTTKKEGSSVISARCDGVGSYCMVKVEKKDETIIPDPDPEPTPTPTPTPVYKASFDKQTYQLYATAKVKAKLVSNMTGDAFVSVRSSNTAIATIAKDGTITGVKGGTATITATTKSGKTISATVKVATPSVKLNLSSIPLQLKKSTTAVKVKTKLSTDSVAKWSSSNSKIITVNAKTGKITARKTGKAYIIVTMKSGATAKCKVTVQKSPVKTTKLTVNQTKVTLKLKGGKKTFQITAVKTPVTSLEKVTYKSSNTKVATVSSKGKITAKKAGKATITVKAGKKVKKITVTVKKK
ncbi:MAG: leucine-rich repeat protein [Eubacterium sp.]